LAFQTLYYSPEAQQSRRSGFAGLIFFKNSEILSVCKDIFYLLKDSCSSTMVILTFFLYSRSTFFLILSTAKVFLSPLPSSISPFFPIQSSYFVHQSTILATMIAMVAFCVLCATLCVPCGKMFYFNHKVHKDFHKGHKENPVIALRCYAGGTGSIPAWIPHFAL